MYQGYSNTTSGYAGYAGGGGGAYAGGQSQGYVVYVYNIGPYATEDAITQLFQPYGQVNKVAIIMDHQRGQNKGYCFVTMADYTEAQNAIYSLNGYDFQGNGRVLTVAFKTEKK